MESGYALPTSALHSHSHSASTLPYSPSRLGLNTSSSSRPSRSERPSSSLHSHSHSDLSHGHDRQDHSHDGHAENKPASSLEGNGYALNTSQTYSPSRSHSPNASHLHDHTNTSSEVGTHEHDPHTHTHSHNHEHSHSHSHSHAHSHSHPHSHIQSPSSDHHDHLHDHLHTHPHNHAHSHNTELRSRFSNMLLPMTETWPLLHSILLEKDSRRLLYFMSLNFCFMMVQAFYGYVTDSLGLLSDSIHMFFDCLALAMGLFAAVSSKWPPSAKFPYGFAKIESLSGFGNGVFLILISIEIMIEAVERLAEGRETKRLTELLVVSSMGLAVNLIGMMAFGHHHHGHSHSGGGCSHGHDHGDHSHSHNNHDHKHTESNSISAPPTPLSSTLTGAHDHGHENQNMAGIYLHILADTMGSAAVIVSTLLIQFLGWSGWDPIASCVIAILIFMSSIPLVSASAKQLLLTVPADIEYKLRSTLSGVSSLRGVASYSVPKFWLAEKTEGDKDQVMGVIHLIATRGADSEEVRQRAREYLSGHGMDVVIQVDREHEGKCWCGGDGTKTPTSSSGSRFS